jgi:hypothetical protein
MTLKDFVAKAKAAILNVYHVVYTEIGTLLSLLKSPDKTKFSSKRVIALALIVNGLWMIRLSKNWFDAGISLIQITGGIALMVVAALTKT